MKEYSFDCSDGSGDKMCFWLDERTDKVWIDFDGQCISLFNLDLGQTLRLAAALVLMARKMVEKNSEKITREVKIS